MTVSEGLTDISRLFLDTAPVIYFVERNPAYLSLVQTAFRYIDQGALGAVTSPVTLAECLVHPIRQQDTALQQDFIDLITAGNNTEFVMIDQVIAQTAAELRARYNLLLPDAFQAAVAIVSGCDALLTNDRGLQRVTELKILTLDDLTLSQHPTSLQRSRRPYMSR